MIADSCGFALIFLITILLAIPLGAYMKRVYNNDKSFLDFLRPIEKRIFSLCGID
ncbi:MAG: potassium-transporting ATPase subunit KdpA, partial [Mucilaginibacter sp.]